MLQYSSATAPSSKPPVIVETSGTLGGALRIDSPRRAAKIGSTNGEWKAWGVSNSSMRRPAMAASWAMASTASAFPESTVMRTADRGQGHISFFTAYGNLSFFGSSLYVEHLAAARQALHQPATRQYQSNRVVQGQHAR